MNITLHGAAGDVTGSAYLVETDQARILVDFGMFQGGPELEAKNEVPAALRPQHLDAIVLTHAHLDHTGRLPMLIRHGYRGVIHATDATIDMAELILRDSARIQASETERENRKRERAGEELLQPLYDEGDVERTISLMKTAPYNTPTPIASGVSIRLVDSGHMLGSASIEMTVEEGETGKVVVFSGDLGPRGLAWLRDARPFDYADMVFLESTYGNRDHRSLRDTLAEGNEIIKESVAKKGKILIPAFAIGRSQQILYHLAALFRSGEVPHFPVFLDSPMAIKATRIYQEHPELFDEEAIELAREGQLAVDMQSVRVAETVEQSKHINGMSGTCVVIASSGMCTAGRIVHHLRHNLWRPETTVIIVGYQANGSLGRQLVDGANSVRIFGERIAVKASIHTLGGFSAHAGQTDLLRWFDAVAASGPAVVLSHGEAAGRESLARKIRDGYGIEARLPFQGDTVSL